ncbi:TolC family protein [Aureibacter tunicatorum]|uniref:Outer membrane protein n=1 Tax=Aureibacter tunicatorum TaxID=866807 RepID=A0AAE3XRM4_9BACT|nr:TolC family protein [Aureibacter tunicatorum]MDR6241862.1 outer membrane protein [Aureibacter tunicatorum]BDD07109.1 hypothetical protein AUTU_45920 [Aureibacter tunicatorum]
MYKLSIIILFLLSQTYLYSQETSKSWSLDDCIKYAIEHRPEALQAKTNATKEKLDLDQAKANRLPEISSSAYQSYRWGRSIDQTTNLFTENQISNNGINVNASLELFGGFKRSRQIEASNLSWQLSRLDYDIVQVDLALKITLHYLNTLHKQELLKENKLQLQSLNEKLTHVEQMIEMGSRSKTDKLEIESQIASLNVQIVQNENGQRLAIQELKQMMTLPHNEIIELNPPEIENINIENFPVEHYYDLALKLRPEIKKADTQILLAKQQLRLARSGIYPTIFLNSSISTNYSSASDIDGRLVPNGKTVEVDPYPIGTLQNSPDQMVYSLPGELAPSYDEVNGYSIGAQWKDNLSRDINISMQIPIFSKLKNHIEIQKAKVNIQIQQYDQNKATSQLWNNVEKAYLEAINAKKIYMATQNEIEIKEKLLNAVNEKYMLGITPFIELRVSQDELIIAQSKLVNSKYDFYFKTLILELYTADKY